MIFKHHLEPRRTFHFVLALHFHAHTKKNEKETKSPKAVANKQNHIFLLAIIILENPLSFFLFSPLPVCQGIYTVKSKCGIHIVIFIDNSETTTRRNDIFSIEINIQQHERDLISIMIAAWCYCACDGVFTYSMEIPSSPNKFFLCNRQHSRCFRIHVATVNP